MATIPRQMMGLPNSPSFRYKQLNPAFQSDPRRILGQQLMQQGSSSAPVATPLQGLGRLSSALVGAYLQKGAVDRQVARESDYQDKLTNALSGMNLPANSPINALAEVDPLTAINAAVLRNTNLEIAKQKTANKKPTFDTLYKDDKKFTLEVGSQEYLNKIEEGYTQDAPSNKTEEFVSVYNLKNYSDRQQYKKGSTELANILNDKNYVLGNPPNPPQGYKYGTNNELTILPGGSAAFRQVTAFMKPINKEAKEYSDSKSALLASKSLAEDQSGASDTGLIFKFFTTLDPGGRVTEGEQASAIASQSYNQQLSIATKRMLKSGVLDDNARNEIITAMKGVVAVRQNKLQTVLNNENFINRLNSLGYKAVQLLPNYDQIFTELPNFTLGKKDDEIKGDLGFQKQFDIPLDIKNSSNQDLLLKFSR